MMDAILPAPFMPTQWGLIIAPLRLKEVIYRLGLGGSSQNLSPNFIQKQELARKLLRSNAYLIQKIPELSRG